MQNNTTTKPLNQNKMTAKEKALDLYNKFRNEFSIMSANIKAKKCALIAVDEILNVIYYESKSEYGYWQQVKQEIINL